jgi:hypothetical protein
MVRAKAKRDVQARPKGGSNFIKDFVLKARTRGFSRVERRRGGLLKFRWRAFGVEALAGSFAENECNCIGTITQPATIEVRKTG